MTSRTVILLSLSALCLGCARHGPGGLTIEAPVAAPSVPASAPTPAAGPDPAPPAAPIDFGAQVRPLLQEKCSPCHFPGGRMYDRLPFDREETIRTLGEALFTRLRDPVDVELLRTFLAQPKDGPAAGSGP